MLLLLFFQEKCSCVNGKMVTVMTKMNTFCTNILTTITFSLLQSKAWLLLWSWSLITFVKVNSYFSRKQFSQCDKIFNHKSMMMQCLYTQEEIIKLDLEKPHSGGLGFSVIGGERGIFVKSVTPGGIAESSGQLQVGDRLLKVSDCVCCSELKVVLINVFVPTLWT